MVSFADIEMNQTENHPTHLVGWLKAVSRGDPFPAPDSPDEWKHLIIDARRHGFIPILWHALKCLREGSVPAEIQHELKAVSMETAARNLLLSSELCQILQAFRKQSIPCIPIRGVVLSEQVFGSGTIRPTGDVDFLIRKERLLDVRKAMAELGFSEVEARPGFAEAFYYALEFLKERHFTVIVEPHWSIAYPPLTDRVDMNKVWGRSVSGKAAGVEAKLLSPEDLLIHLCLHIVHHAEEAPLLWYYEIDRLIRSEPFRPDWLLLESLIGEAGLADLACPVLWRIHSLFNTPFPDAIFGKWTAPSSNALSGRMRYLLASPESLKGREKVATLLQLSGFRRKLRYVLSFLFPSPRFVRIQYGVSSPLWLPIVYLKRLWYLCSQGLKTLMRFAASG